MQILSEKKLLLFARKIVQKLHKCFWDLSASRLIYYFDIKMTNCHPNTKNFILFWDFCAKSCLPMIVMLQYYVQSWKSHENAKKSVQVISHSIHSDLKWNWQNGKWKKFKYLNITLLPKTWICLIFVKQVFLFFFLFFWNTVVTLYVQFLHF